MSDTRLELAKQWLNALFAASSDTDQAALANGSRSTKELTSSGWTIEVASADASFRRYFRIVHNDGRTQILMDAPPEKENIHPFVDIAKRLTAVNLHAPEILAEDYGQGFLLLSDLGNRTYLPELSSQTAGELYGDAMQALRILATADTTGLPKYDEKLLRNEMALFNDWYLGEHKKIQLSEVEQSVWGAINDRLISNALEQPQVFVHRDYHSRNLMIVENNNPGIIDFQDAVIGPATYDLVSLLRDCYIAWPQTQVECWVEGYRQQAGIEVDPKQFLRWFDLMGVQRHLKAIGIFARLNHRDGKPGYLDDIPRTLGYVREVSSRYSELAGLQHLIENHLGETA